MIHQQAPVSLKETIVTKNTAIHTAYQRNSNADKVCVQTSWQRQKGSKKPRAEVPRQQKKKETKTKKKK